MDYHKRKKTIDKLEFLECNFPVDKWQVNNIHIWPIFKNLIFVHSSSAEEASITQNNIKRSNFFQKIIKGINILNQFFSLSLKPTDFLFSGGNVHRAWNDNIFVNRYFDPMIEYLKSKGISVIGMEYVGKYKGPLNFQRVETLNLLFYRDKTDFEILLKDKEFNEFINFCSSYFPLKQAEILVKLKSALLDIDSWKRFYLYVLKKVKPKYCFGLCYYSYPMYGMNLAAKELGILSIDMQHGAQGRFHPSYYFTKVPRNGYNCLPEEFWCWEEDSCNSLKSSSLHKEHKIVLSGNPWVNYLTKSIQKYESLFPKDKPIILFTHQPLQPVISTYLLEAIAKTSDEYHWWIRLHPRISIEDQETLKMLLKSYQLENIIEIEKASLISLPVILKNCQLHLSKYSGSIIEAMLTGTFSIVLDNIGIMTFHQIIADGKALGLEDPSSDELISIIHQQINSGKKNAAVLTCFQSPIEELLSRSASKNKVADLV